MRSRPRARTLVLAFVALLAVGCMASGVLLGSGAVHPHLVEPGWWPAWAPSAHAGGAADGDSAVVGPVDRARAGNVAHAPPRRRIRMVPTPFAAASISPRTGLGSRSLRGTPWANIVVFPDRVQAQTGTRVLWTGYFRELPGFTGSITLDAVAGLVARGPVPTWLTETGRGVFLLRAGLVQTPGTVLTVAAPRVTELRLLSAPYVYVSGVAATGRFSAVKVTSWSTAANGPDTDPTRARPFIAYTGGSRLDIADCDLGFLGTDTSFGYGVSWGARTSGEARHSVFHNNLFGAYTSRAVGVAFRDNVFRDNARYGLDPHTGSRNLTITGNEAYANNTHGIIFSQGVVDSVIAGNRSHDNGANGIMMDQLSNDNVIRDNVTEHNAGAGIVLQGSSADQVSGNTVGHNPIGIRVNATPRGASVANQVSDNQVTGNGVGIKVYNHTDRTMLVHNSIRDTADTALALVDPTTSRADSVSNAAKGVVISNGTSTLHALSTRDVASGVVVGSGATAIIDAGDISAARVGIRMRERATLALTEAPTLIADARKAVVVNGTADLNNLTLRDVVKGVVLAPSAFVSIDRSRLVATQVGLEVLGLRGAERVSIHDTTIEAANPVAGASFTDIFGNHMVSVLSWLEVSGAVFVVLALVLYLVGRSWSRRPGPGNPSAPPYRPSPRIPARQAG